VPAVAIAMNVLEKQMKQLINLNVEGGKLAVSFDNNGGVFKCILKGPAQFVFQGTVEI
jgi:diaminopimelate epimerase